MNFANVRFTILWLLARLFTTTDGQISQNEFYPYGLIHGDLTLPPVDDDAIQMPIRFSLPFFGQAYRVLHISTNGNIAFGRGVREYVPVPFPIIDSRIIASYWTDSDPSRGGTVFYRETEDESILSRATQDITSRFLGHQSFVARWVLIVTFQDVPAYGCGNPAGGCSTPCSMSATFQTVLTSNGINSFACFYYNKLHYTVGTANCNAHAQIGFNAGDGIRYFLVPGSNTRNISQAALSNSNVGTPGKWMFNMDGSDIGGGCNERGLLEIYPRKLLYFAGENVTIAGPCFNSTDQVSIYFENQLTTCPVNSAGQATCRVPLLDKLGSNEIILRNSNTTYNSFIIGVYNDETVSSDVTFTNIVNNDPNSAFTITWNTATVGNSSARILLKGIQVDYLLNSNGEIISKLNLDLIPGEFNNTGSATVTPIPNQSGSSFMRSIALAGSSFDSRVFPAVRSVIIASASICESFCGNWFNMQPNTASLKVIVEELSTRSPCAPGVTLDFPRSTGNFEHDERCNPFNPSMCSYFHPGATACYRSTNNNGGKVVQCCYDSNGRLLIGPPGGGAIQFSDSRSSIESHIQTDILPFVACCKCSTNQKDCFRYHEKRPSIDSSQFRPPGSGGGGGDPHFVTLDGTSYTFNPVGEFIYFQALSDTIQVRISPFVDDDGRDIDACYFSAFVIRGGDSDVIQAEVNSVERFSFYVNHVDVNLQYGIWPFRNIMLSYENNSTAVIATSSEVRLELRISAGILQASISVPEAMKGQVSGLVGNWDDDPTNDLQLPNGTWIPVNSSLRDVHYNFGTTWRTTNVTTLFTYPLGLTWWNYQDISFVPSFQVPAANPLCGNDLQCAFDIAVTRNVDIGLSSVEFKQHLNETRQNNERISSLCPLTVRVPNGEVRVTEYDGGTRVLYSITCEYGYAISGNRDVTCLNGKYDPLGTCVQVESDAAMMVGVKEAHLIGALALALFGMMRWM